jgi:hypothetical protein
MLYDPVMSAIQPHGLSESDFTRTNRQNGTTSTTSRMTAIPPIQAVFNNGAYIEEFVY